MKVNGNVFYHQGTKITKLLRRALGRVLRVLGVLVVRAVVRRVIAHASGVLYLSDRQVALAVVGDGFESRFAGEEVVAQISRIAQARYEEDSRRADR